MTQNNDFGLIIKPMQDILRLFLDKKIEYTEFQKSFQSALDAYEEYETKLGDQVDYRLKVVANPPQHLSSRLTHVCQKALDYLEVESLNRSTRTWVENTLIVAEDRNRTHFSLQGDGEAPLFEIESILYSARLDGSSFLLSAIHGKIPKAAFTYDKLLESLFKASQNDLACWVYGAQDDNVIAKIIKIYCPVYPCHNSYPLEEIERRPASSGGASYLLLIPRSKLWILENYYNYSCFEISIHGNKEFVSSVISKLGVMPQWRSEFMPRNMRYSINYPGL